MKDTTALGEIRRKLNEDRQRYDQGKGGQKGGGKDTKGKSMFVSRRLLSFPTFPSCLYSPVFSHQKHVRGCTWKCSPKSPSNLGRVRSECSAQGACGGFGLKGCAAPLVAEHLWLMRAWLLPSFPKCVADKSAL